MARSLASVPELQKNACARSAVDVHAARVVQFPSDRYLSPPAPSSSRRARVRTCCGDVVHRLRERRRHRPDHRVERPSNGISIHELRSRGGTPQRSKRKGDGRGERGLGVERCALERRGFQGDMIEDSKQGWRRRLRMRMAKEEEEDEEERGGERKEEEEEE